MEAPGNLKRVIPQNPASVIALSFLLTILLGSFLLSLPIATTGGKISFVNALFTATSATCVTGLVVVDTGSYFTIFGQLVILSLIQLGGLGIMTLSSFFTLLLGKKLSIKSKMIVLDSLDYYDVDTLSKLLKAIFLLTIGIEFLGAVPLFFKWLPDMGAIKALYYAIFHSVSAFCNAGFALYPDSFIICREDVVINLVISTLIILGGIGFVVLMDLRRYFGAKRQRSPQKAISLQSKIVLGSSGILILLGMLTVLLLEWNNPATLQPLSFQGKLLASFFGSVTCRTAGFNTLPTGSLYAATSMIFVVLMFIGASPGSTGGGIKTTTLAIFLATVWSMMLDKDRVCLFKRTIPRKEIQRSIVIIGLSSLLVILCTLLLVVLDSGLAKGLLHHLFEVVSAFGTVGLSTGVTPNLSISGRLLITLIMFIGRTGPLTVALALSNSSSKYAPSFRYPEGRIMVG